jgi:hypothetical protein
MRVKLKLPETERKRQDRFVRRAEKRVCQTKLTQHRGPIHPHWSVPASADEARREKHLIRRQDQANLPSNGRPLGGCRLKKEGMALEIIIGLIIAAVVGIIIGKDASARGMSGAGWGIFTFFICIIAVPIYLIVRRPRLDER